MVLDHPSFAKPVRLPRIGGVPAGGEIVLGLRPEQLSLDGGADKLELTADLCENLGGATLIYGKTPSGETVVLQTPGRRMLKKDEPFTASFDALRAYVFDPSGKAM